MSFRHRLVEAQKKRAAAAAASFANDESFSLLADVLTPRDAELTNVLTSVVQEITDHDRPTNSQKAMDPKKEEWMQFCDALYPSDPYRHIINSDKCYRFMCYQSFRESKKRGGEKSLLKKYIYFDYDNYVTVMNQFQNGQFEGDKRFPTPDNPIGYSVFQSYKAALKQLFREQQAKHGASVTNSWEHVWLPHFDRLRDHVKSRRHKVKKMNYEEKIDGAFAPYAIVEHYGDIEDKFFSSLYDVTNIRSISTGLRHRFCFLFLTSGILRCESVYQAELSDFQGINMCNNERDLHPLFIMIMQIPFGKTNKGSIRYGRATRHRDVRLCCIGALTFYLNLRFFVTNEFASFSLKDWCDNSKWFDTKLLVDVHGPTSYSKQMKNDSYSKKIKEILKELGVPYNKLLHLGRNLGAKMLDLLEELKDEKRSMGQWAPDVIDNSYSSKLPMRPIRKLAGYTTQQVPYHNVRTVVEPSEALLRQTPMGSWCYDAYSDVCEATRSATGNHHQTALQVLKFFCYINKVLVQDSAAMLILHPQRSRSPFFKVLPFLTSDEFQSFRGEMRSAILGAKDPMENSLDVVVPGLVRWHRSHQDAFVRLNAEVKKMKDNFLNKINDLSRETKVDRLKSAYQLSLSLQKLSESYTSSFESDLNKFTNLMASTLDNEETGGSSSINVNDGTNLNVNATTTSTINNHSLYVDSNNPTNSTTSRLDSNDNEEEKREQEIARATKTLCSRHKCLQDVYNEWYGLDSFYDIYGGIDGREKRFGTSWRKHTVSSHLFSRTKRCIIGINQFARENNMTPMESVATLEETFAECNFSIYNLVQKLKTRGLVMTKASRGKTKK